MHSTEIQHVYIKIEYAYNIIRTAMYKYFWHVSHNILMTFVVMITNPPSGYVG